MDKNITAKIKSTSVYVSFVYTRETQKMEREYD